VAIINRFLAQSSSDGCLMSKDAIIRRAPPVQRKRIHLVSLARSTQFWVWDSSGMTVDRTLSRGTILGPRRLERWLEVGGVVGGGTVGF
jgi:hypothetical protein